MLKVAYGFGLRRTEVQMLDLADFNANPHAGEFGEYGVCQVRFGKAGKGSPPKRRSVLTVWEWVPSVLEQWIGEARPIMPAAAASAALWPSERGPRVGITMLDKRFAEYRGRHRARRWPRPGLRTWGWMRDGGVMGRLWP